MSIFVSTVMMMNGIVDILYDILLFIFFRLNPPAPASICCCICFRVLHAHKKRPGTFSANSQLANLRRTNHYLILDRYGQIDSCSHDIVDVRPTGCLVNACACLPFSLPASERRRPFLRRAEKLPFSLFQHLSNVCMFAVSICFLYFSARKDGSNLKVKN